MQKHIFAGIDLGDKNSVARIGVDREKDERLGFVNTRGGRARLFKELNRRANQAGGAKIVLAYEASSCGWRLSIKLCFETSEGSLKSGLKHGVELR